MAAILKGTESKVANVITLLLKSVLRHVLMTQGRVTRSTRRRSQLLHEETKKPRTLANYVTGGAGRENLIKSS